MSRYRETYAGMAQREIAPIIRAIVHQETRDEMNQEQHEAARAQEEKERRITIRDGGSVEADLLIKNSQQLERLATQRIMSSR